LGKEIIIIIKDRDRENKRLENRRKKEKYAIETISLCFSIYVFAGRTWIEWSKIIKQASQSK